MTRSRFAFLTAFAVLALDRLAKLISVKSLVQGQSVRVVPGIFHITLVHNTGAAFGMFQGQTAAFSLVALVVIVFITIFLVKARSVERVFAFSLGLILGGAAGNLIDRIWFGYVIDIFDFRVWPVFNIADSCITIGTIILAVNILTQK